MSTETRRWGCGDPMGSALHDKAQVDRIIRTAIKAYKDCWARMPKDNFVCATTGRKVMDCKCKPCLKFQRLASGGLP